MDKSFKNTQNKNIILGIDIGTCNLRVAAWLNGKPQIILNNQGQRSTPNYFAISGSQELIGEPAMNQQNRNISNTIFNINRLIGRTFSQLSEKQDIKKWPFTIQKSPNDQILIFMKSKQQTNKFYPQDILAAIFQNIKKSYQNVLGILPEKILMGVPDCFNQNQRQSILLASHIAGLKIERLINQSSAIALAYGYEHSTEEQRTYLIFDFGGGKLDISVVTNDCGILQVKGSVGDLQFGGEDLDNILVQYCASQFHKKYNINLRSNLKAMRRLKISAQRVKRILSSANQAIIEVDNLIQSHDFQLNIKRLKFQQICADKLKQITTLLDNVIKISFIKKQQITDIIFMGGSSRIPKVRQIIQNYFNNKQFKKTIYHQQAVVNGAVLYAAVLFQPNEKIQQFLLIDIIPYSLGIQTVGNTMTKIVPAHTTYPTKKFCIFTTFFDNQNQGLIKIYEGNSSYVDKNVLIGVLYLQNIPYLPKQTQKIQITFTIYQNKAIQVQARVNINSEQIIYKIIIKKTQKEGIDIKNNNLLQLKVYNQMETLQNTQNFMEQKFEMEKELKKEE